MAQTSLEPIVTQLGIAAVLPIATRERHKLENYTLERFSFDIYLMEII